MSPPKPRTQAPPLEVEIVDGESWRLADQNPGAFTMVVFYRGLHCPICKGYLRHIDRRLDDFASRGVGVITISGDDRERAAETKRAWGIERLPIGYGQSIASMREWGLFVSRAIRDDEPDLFGEPGLFLISPDGTVFWEAISSMPFARPSTDEVILAIDTITKKNYPARGEA